MHYYEDGNVRLTTSKPVPDTSISSSGSTAADITKQIAAVERKYQEELNRGFTALSEGSFKNLRRQLPITRQKVEWEKVGGYRVGFVCPLLGLGEIRTDYATVGAGYRWWETTIAGQCRFFNQSYKEVSGGNEWAEYKFRCISPDVQYQYLTKRHLWQGRSNRPIYIT